MPRWPVRTVEERFWAHVDKAGPVPELRLDLGPCWLWREIVPGNGGYGKFRIGARTIRAYRVAYEMCVGPIPEGLEPDHLCRVNACVRPSHLELVTHRENTLRGESPAAKHAAMVTCPRGHAFTIEKNQRRCRECKRERERGYYAAKKVDS